MPSPTPGSAGIANPATVYCVDQDYRLEARTAKDGVLDAALLLVARARFRRARLILS